MAGFNQVVPESSFVRIYNRTYVFFLSILIDGKIKNSWMTEVHYVNIKTFKNADYVKMLELLGANDFSAGLGNRQKTQTADPSTENMGAMIKMINHDNFIPTTVVES